MEALLETLEENHHLIVLWGSGGVGKTTVAAEIGRRWRARDSQRRVIRLDVERLPRPTHGSSLTEIGIQCGTGPLRGDSQARERALRSALASKRTLIIIDGVEHLPDAQRDDLFRFLQVVPSSALVTSREYAQGLRNQSVDPMTGPEAEVFLDRLIHQSGNSRRFTGATRKRLLQWSEGNPQILEWLVGQMNLGRLAGSGLSQLRRGQGDAAARVFGLSFDLPQLKDDGQVVLLSLGLFATDASRPALAAVAGFDKDWPRLDEAVDRLASLRLISTTEDGERITVQGLTREMVVSRLEGDSRKREIQERFIAYFHRFVEEG